jgi:hypothetical protein
VDAGTALLAAGRLLAVHQATSPVAASAHFGGGAAAVRAAPVSPRGAGDLVLFSILALLALALTLAAASRLRLLRRQRATNAGPPGSPAPPGPPRLGYGPRPGATGYPGNGYPGAGYPSTGYTAPGSDYGGADDHA